MESSNSIKPNSLRAWVLATRPKTLLISFVPFFTGTMLAYGQGVIIKPYLFFAAWLFGLCIQISVNLFNDAIDFMKGADTSTRKGFLRTAQANLLPAPQIIRVGWIVCALGMLIGIPLIYEGGLVMFALMALSVLFSYGYTGGRYSIAYTGTGEIFLIIFFGFIATGSAYWIQAHRFNWDVFVLAIQNGFLAIIPMHINNLRDWQEDRLINKKTTVVRFGLYIGRIELIVVACVPFLLSYYWVFKQNLYAALLPWITLPLALYLVANIWMKEPSPTYNDYLAKSALLMLCFGLFISIGFLI